MRFRTEYDPRPGGFSLDPTQTAVLLGSCFTDNIGTRMRLCRWRAFPNDCGTLFNPASIARIIHLALSPECLQEAIDSSLAPRNGIWSSWLMDSGASSESREETACNVSQRINRLHDHLKEAKTLIVTFGTSWIYELRDKPGYVVSNCHKFPSDLFIRRRLGVSEIVVDWELLLVRLHDFNPELKVLFTVSPVRHLKDGFEGNSRSKATLLLACEELCAQANYIDYFPAYEIVNDDLRDYRFYAADMVHPSDQAVEYIWEKFQLSFMSDASRSLLAEGEKVTRRLHHRPIILGRRQSPKASPLSIPEDALEVYESFIARNPSMLRLEEEC